MPATATQTDPELQARRLWGPVLESWAADCLRLRANGLDRPSVRRGHPGGPHALRPRRPALHGQRPAPTGQPRWAA